LVLIPGVKRRGITGVDLKTHFISLSISLLPLMVRAIFFDFENFDPDVVIPDADITRIVKNRNTSSFGSMHRFNFDYR
jgi:hypothetical protein